MIISLPLPDKSLSPNARVHWRPKAVLVRAAREYAFWVTRQQQGKAENVFSKLVGLTPNVTVTIHFPDNRKRDLDNAIASTKAYSDGIADALGVDDALWNITYQRGEVIKGGRITYEVTP